MDKKVHTNQFQIKSLFISFFMIILDDSENKQFLTDSFSTFSTRTISSVEAGTGHEWEVMTRRIFFGCQ